MSHRERAFEQMKAQHQAIEIPAKLSTLVESAITKGIAEKTGRPQNTAKPQKQWWRGLAAAAAALTIFTTAVNVSPGFADQLSQIPVVGDLVKILNFTDGRASGGNITDGTDVSAVDLSANGSVEQFTFKFEQDGGAQTLAGAYEVKYQERPYTMTFAISGARIMSAASDFDKLKKSQYVSEVYPIVTLDDSMVRFAIVFKGPVAYELKEMKAPSSLVLTLTGAKESENATPYALKTQSMAQGEGLAMVEEMLSIDFPNLRVLRDELSGEKDLFYLEVGQYPTKAEAEKMQQMGKDRGVELTLTEAAK